MTERKYGDSVEGTLVAMIAAEAVNRMKGPLKALEVMQAPECLEHPACRAIGVLLAAAKELSKAIDAMVALEREFRESEAQAAAPKEVPLQVVIDELTRLGWPK